MLQNIWQPLRFPVGYKQQQPRSFRLLGWLICEPYQDEPSENDTHKSEGSDKLRLVYPLSLCPEEKSEKTKEEIDYERLANKILDYIL